MPAPTHLKTASRDLTDAEFAELDELLAATPEPLEPLDAVMLDGYLCGVLVQPVLLEPATWLAHVFDFDGRPLPDDVDPAWRQRATALIMRRHAHLNQSLLDDGWFDPLVLEFDEDQPPPVPAEGEVDAMAGLSPERSPDAMGQRRPEDEPLTPRDSTDASVQRLSPVSQSLMPWVAGFQHATITFPDLMELPDDAVMSALARLFRHLPAETDEEREVVATLEREHPLATLDDAMEDMVVIVADLCDLTRDLRYKVDTVKRESPKVGRNDPCPCGSGKKFKQCHGA
jgi:uncharacterized protein